MKIVMISENDPAGMGITFTKAINDCTEHSCRLITTATRYNFEFEKDLHVPDFLGDEWDEVDQLLRETDIIHFHILADEHLPFGPLKIKDYISGKRILHHHHGHPDFRNNPQKYREKYKQLKRKAIVSTPDLLKLMPEAGWQPNLVPINEEAYLPPKGWQPAEILKVAHSPTRKDLKNTADLIGVVDGLNEQYRKQVIRLEIIENCKHRECLRRKKDADIVFDHMQGYYGVSSLESLSQGKPVIAGIDEWNRTHIEKFTNYPKLPWIVADNKAALFAVLSEFLHDREKIGQIGRSARHFMEKCWNEERLVMHLMNFYNEL